MRDLEITTDWEALNEGSPEERSAFASLAIRWGEIWLTEGRDRFVNVLRKGPYVSAFHLAEWLAWNWWRLRWEPRSTVDDWAFAHDLSSIGEGYVWPSITIFSDGERTALLTRPTSDEANSPFRYINDVAAIVSSRDFEACLDDFVERVRGKLRADAIARTSLDSVWEELLKERSEPALAERRRFEALLSCNPDEANEQTIDSLIEDSKALGESAMREVAAGHSNSEVLTAATLADIAERDGFDASPRSSFSLSDRGSLSRPRDVAAWRLGAQAAHLVRDQAGLRMDPISDVRLAELVGVSPEALSGHRADRHIAYALDLNSQASRIVLRSGWREGRRFEMARILGDRLIRGQGNALFPATRANTYWQKMQRSFAAELLSPFVAVDDAMEGDYSEERQQEVAERFEVSPLAINTLLKNHGRIERGAGDEDIELTAKWPQGEIGGSRGGP